MQTNKEKVIKMPTGDINKDLEIIEKVSLNTLKTVGTLNPTLYIIGKEYAHIISGQGLPETNEERKAIFANIGEKMGIKMPEAYGFVAVLEAWSSTAKKGDKISPPREDPERVETLIISARKANGDALFLMKPFKKVDGKIKLVAAQGGLKELNSLGWIKHGDTDPDKRVEDSLMTELWTKFKLSAMLNNLK